MRWLMWLMVLLSLSGCTSYMETRDNRITVDGNSVLILVVEGVDVSTARRTGQEADGQFDLDTALSQAGATAAVAAKDVIMEKVRNAFDASQEATTTEPEVKPEEEPDKSPEKDPETIPPEDDGNTNTPPGDDNGDVIEKPPEDSDDMHGYKYKDTLSYIGPIQIAPAGQQGNSTYYYFLYRLPKGHHGYQTYGKKFLIKYPDGKLITINDSRHDYNKKGYWYRPGDSSGHKEVHSMEVYWGKDGQWKNTSKADRDKTKVTIYSNIEREK